MEKRAGQNCNCDCNCLPGHIGGVTESRDLPGVSGLHEHALQAEKACEESEAACKIQAAYRGYTIRKILPSELPTLETLWEVSEEGRNERDGVEEEEELAKGEEETLIGMEEVDLVQVDDSGDNVSPNNAGPGRNPSSVLLHQHESKQAIPVVPTEPWKKDAGDSLSAITAVHVSINRIGTVTRH